MRHTSKYTTELRFICENYAGLSESTDNSSTMSVIENSRAKLFDFDYPIFDETYRKPLELKIMRHFYCREIGFETVGRFKLALCDKLNVIMPLYNQLYQSQLLDFNPFYDVEYSTTHSGSGTGDTSRTDTGTTADTSERTTNASETTTETSERNTSGSSTTQKNGTDNYSEGRDSTFTAGQTVLTSVQHTGSDSTTNSSQSTTNETNSTSTTTVEKPGTSTYRYYSDTPQGNINGFASREYLTNVTQDVQSGENDTTATNTGSSTVSVNGSGSTTVSYGGTDTTTTKHSGSDTSGEGVTHEGTSSQTESGTQSGTDKYGVTASTTDTATDKYTASGTTSTTGSESVKTTEEYLTKVAGKMGGATYSEMLLKYRDTFLNIDKLLIDELEELFFGLW